MRKFAIAVVVPALLAGACGGAEFAGDEELTARPLPREAPQADETEDAGEVEAGAELGDTDTPDTPEDGPAKDVEADGPAEADTSRDAEAAAYLQQALPADALDHDVLLVDRADDGQLLLAMVTAEGEAIVEAARWADGVFEQADRVDAGPAEALGTLRTPTVDGGSRVVALGLNFDGDLRIAVWNLHDERLETPQACPIDEPREIRGQGSGEVTVSCEADDGEVLVWHDGAFVPVAHAARTERPEDEVDDGEDFHEDEREQAGDRSVGIPGNRAAGQGGRSDAADSSAGAQGRGQPGR